MNYGLCTSSTLLESDCLILGLFEDGEPGELVRTLDEQLHGMVSRLFGKLQESGDWTWQADTAQGSLMLIHCGKSDEFTIKQLRKKMAEILTNLRTHKIRSATLCLPSLSNRTPDWQLTQMLLMVDAHCYQLNSFKTKHGKPPALESVCFHIKGADQNTLDQAQAIATGITFTRTLADLPANYCTPGYLGEQALLLAKEHNTVTTNVMGPDEMRNLGMGAFLAVAQGSQEEPRLIEMHYRGGGDLAPVVLVGKGITFDSGGLSLKPANTMDEMKYDMCGAASVFGTIKACALLQLPVNVIGLVASAENLPSGSAVKPGDIVTSMSGQTIEIINTDAEGRLVLADALTYAERYKPKMVLDIATLTGAMVVALGYITTGFMTQDEELADILLAASETSADKCWRMPMDDEYQDALESPLADMINGAFDRSGGSITAACFLSRFTKHYRWAHLDIAGTAWVTGKKRQATGRPVALLIELLRHVSNTR
ncbi:leucyl aminopeptidase [Legionella spiritensis]|uniref:leucyl aminopeptidase n=1 Tax=Legionella spiritensis TaxID=452 RepID=UPI000F6CFEFC|nr:leucyl aminopeptidase [Legionella spiritensis]VEG90738.1 aminopeptidase A/I [Legionella spiritensis]